MFCLCNCYIAITIPILIMGTNDNVPTNVTDVSAIKAELIDLGVKSIRASHQLRYLLNTRSNGNIAKGIATQMKCTCSVKYSEFISSCNKLNIEHKSRMFDLVIDNQKSRTKHIKALFYSRKDHYRQILDHITFSRIDNDIVIFRKHSTLKNKF